MPTPLVRRTLSSLCLFVSLSARLLAAAPEIVSLPTSATAAYGGNASIAVTATGGALTYQWYEGASGDITKPVPGATAAQLVSLPLRTSTSFWVRVTNADGPTDSAAVAVTPTGGTLCGMGNRAAGQLGDHFAGAISEPAPIASLVETLGAGASRSFYTRTDGSLWAGGDNTYGTLGDATTSSRSIHVRVLDSGVAAVSSGSSHTLILKSDGSLWGCGAGRSGCLGDSTTTARPTPFALPAFTSGVAAAVAGPNCSLVLLTDGSLWAFGDNSYGQLGLGATTTQTTPTKVPGFESGTRAIATLNYHTLILRDDGSLWTCGINSYSQLGLGHTTTQTTPQPVPGFGSGVAAIAAGNLHSLILKTDGSLWACGYNGASQLGLGHTTNQTTPQPVPGFGSGVAAIAAGNQHSLILKTDGSLWACGSNNSGELGDGSTSARNTPVPVSGCASGVTSMAAGAGYTMIRRTDGSLWVCGNPNNGQLGLGLTSSRTSPVPFAESVTTADASNQFSHLVTATGALAVTGFNQYGVLGNGLSSTATPTTVLEAGVRAVANGRNHTLVLRDDGSVWSFGYNEFGQLGDGTGPRIQATPVRILETGAVAVAAGDYHSVVLKGDGSVWTCGQNLYGQLGDGTTTNRNVLTPIPSLSSGVVAIAAGSAHNLFLKNNGSVFACGENSAGQLGDSTYPPANRTTPVAVQGVSGIVAIAAGGVHSLLLRFDGTVGGIGSNSSGQLLNANNAGGYPSGLDITNVAGIAAGPGQSFFIKRDGSLWACGLNTSGQLGDGSTTNRNTLGRILPSGVLAAYGGVDHALVLTTNPPPRIVTQPASGITTLGQPATLAVVASGGTLHYQWYRGATGDTATPVANSDTATLTTPALTDVAFYWVRVTNEFGSIDSDTAILVPVAPPALTGIETWRQLHFGTIANSGTAADTADPDADGLCNLLEYALARDPLVASAATVLFTGSSADASGTHVTLAFSRVADPLLTYTVEASDTLAAGSWTALISSTGTANTAGTFTYTDPELMSGHQRRFFRLRVSY